MRSRDLIPTIYGPSLRRVLRFRRSAVFLLACGMHAAGHACLALTAARCAGLLGGGGTGLLAAGSAGEGSNVGWLADPLALAALGLGAVAVKGLGGAWASFEEGRIVGEVGAGLRLEVLDGWLALHRLRSPRQRDQGGRPPGARPAAALAALTEHVRELETGLGVGVLGAVRAVAQLVPLVAALVLLAPRLAGVAAAAFGGFSLVLGRARHAWKAANARGAAEREALLAAADEAVKHAELWTTFGAEGRVRSHVAAIGARLARRGARLAASAAGLSAANEVLGAAALVLAIAAGRAGWLGAGGEAVLLPFAVTFFLAYRPIRDLTDARLALARASVSAEAIAPLLAPVPAPAPARPRGSEHVWTPAELAIDRLLLAHGDGAPISLRADAGSIVAVVGSTGSGKTTLLRTLLGLEGALAGEVRFGGRRIDAACAGPEARPFAWVPQEAPLLADTLAANVALAPGAADPRGALDAVGAGPLHEALGATPVGAGGRALSGGERQWVSLARAVATRQPVLLLDEPTSGLDPASQARVLEAIARLRGERTVLLVTHREEPLAIADQVIRLDRPVTGTSGPAS